MQLQIVNKKANAKLVKRLSIAAVDGFYYFDDDAIEAFIDRLDLKFKGRRDCRLICINALISHPKFAPIIFDVANKMWGKL